MNNLYLVTELTPNRKPECILNLEFDNSSLAQAWRELEQKIKAAQIRNDRIKNKVNLIEILKIESLTKVWQPSNEEVYQCFSRQ